MLNKEEQRILRLANFLCEQEPLERFFENDQAGDVDWEVFVNMIMEHCMSPLCYLPISRHAPEDYAGKLKTGYGLHRIKTLNDVRVAYDITHLLSAKGIHSTVAKGFPLSHYIYGDCFVRKYSDIDIFVDRNHLPQACRLLLENGYVCHDFDAASESINIDNDDLWYGYMEPLVVKQLNIREGTIY